MLPTKPSIISFKAVIVIVLLDPSSVVVNRSCSVEYHRCPFRSPRRTREREREREQERERESKRKQRPRWADRHSYITLEISNISPMKML